MSSKIYEMSLMTLLMVFKAREMLKKFFNGQLTFGLEFDRLDPCGTFLETFGVAF